MCAVIMLQLLKILIPILSGTLLYSILRYVDRVLKKENKSQDITNVVLAVIAALYVYYLLTKQS